MRGMELAPLCGFAFAEVPDQVLNRADARVFCLALRDLQQRVVGHVGPLGHRFQPLTIIGGRKPGTHELEESFGHGGA